MVPVRCAKCGFAITLHMIPSLPTPPQLPTTSDSSCFGYGYDWDCSSCQHVNSVEQHGQVVGLTIGHAGPETSP
jgi:hypothetical protein